MICKNCGNTIEDNLRFCTHCGAMQDPSQVQEEVNTPPVQEQPVGQEGGQYQPGLSYDDFYKVAVTKKSQGWPKWMMIICYVTAALGLINFFLVGPLALLDIAVYATSAIMLTKSKKKLWVLIPTVYGGIFTIVGLATGASLTGIVALIVGIMSVSTLTKVEKAYASYQATGIIPAQQI